MHRLYNIVDENHQMDMVGHHHENGDVGIRIVVRNIYDALLRVFPNNGQLHCTIDDFPKIMLSI